MNKKVALVSGASSGIGKSAVMELVKKGFEVYAAYFNKMYSNNRASYASVIGRLIAKASVIRNPAPRYAAGKMAMYSLIGRKLLPDRIFDWALSKQVS